MHRQKMDAYREGIAGAFKETADDPLYTRVFGEILTGGGVQPIRRPPKSPNLNASAERLWLVSPLYAAPCIRSRRSTS